MTTLLAKNANVLVTMDDQRREIVAGGLFAEPDRFHPRHRGMGGADRGDVAARPAADNNHIIHALILNRAVRKKKRWC